ncbi:MAG: tryptophan-rich sensory protein [Chlorobiaceae bacterium]|nr:tryptophan-rich sensory protein [Chlorobiaceae bacterium]NTW73528.1 tryptophan-rich sensory protein [Chlorobiaceae bacterium]
MESWYDTLNKPLLTPPKKIFGPVWAGLYLLIFSALAVYFLTPSKPHFLPTVVLLILHFSAGFAWTSIFFGRKLILPALFDLLFMDVTLTAILALFLPANSISALLLLPYAGWCLFATWLNWSIWRLNRHTGERPA